MSLRRRFRKARDRVRDIFSSPDNSRPPTPTSIPTHPGTPAGGSRETTDLEAGVNVPPNQSPTQVPKEAALTVLSQQEVNSAGNRSEGQQDPTDTVKSGSPAEIDMNIGTPVIGQQASSTSPVVPAKNETAEQQEAEPIGSSVVPEKRDHSEAQPVQVPSTTAESEVIANESSVRWKCLTEFVRVLSPVTNLFGPVKEMAEMLLNCVDKYEMAGEAKTQYEALRVRLEILFKDLQAYFGEGCSPAMTSSIEGLSRSIKAEVTYIQARQDRSPGKRYLDAKDETDTILACYHRVESHLQRLSLNANLSMWKIVHEQANESNADRMSSRTDRLSPSLSARYNSAKATSLKRRACTPGTRVDVLSMLLVWAKGPGKGAVYWLNGMAGTGKTTISYSVCEVLDGENKLAASFFCSRLREDCRNVDRIIPSIAYQLSHFSRPFQCALSTVIEKDPDVHDRLPNIQFRELIAKPLLAVEHTLLEGMVVVIDALDECEDKKTTGQVLDILLSEAGNLPIKFIVSSRPEPELRDQVTEGRVGGRLVLHELEKDKVQADIEVYLRAELAAMSPSNEQIAALVEKAGILFIYAATAVRFIGYDNFQSDPEDRLRTILDGSGSGEGGETADIDQLYITVLEAAFENPRLRKVERDAMRQILYTVICAREPLTIAGLSNLFQINNVTRVRSVLRPLWSVLHVMETSELVTTLHASFPDFLFDPTRSKTYWCDSNAHHRKFAEHCLEFIAQTKTQFNICGLESSYIPDQNVPDITNRVNNAISSELLYACRYWADHVKAANCALGVVEHIRGFLSMRLLLWMEILNLTNHMKAGIECMKLAVEWCKLKGEQELAELSQDAKRFVEAFSSNPVSQSTPHIYLSMLAFWPRSAPIVKHYVKYTQGPVEAKGTALDRRQLAHLSTWAFEKSIEKVTVSPDGQYLALAIGSEVLVVDSTSGKVVLGPLPGHSNEVKAVAFSPDGLHIIAGSFDSAGATILGWDSRSGDAVLGPFSLRGHTDSIYCLSFSPDCSLIATGSGDKTVRLWNAQTGQMLLQLEAQDSVGAVAFSPDGTRVAAAFGQALQVWDSQSGETILGPVTDIGLHGIDRIALSPDNSRIICARSFDKVILVGDAQRDGIVFRQIAQHPVNINCIACSPDGKHVVSGSWDRTVRLWDTETGNMLLGPLEAHTSVVNSVTFLPDGSRVISACQAGLVCTWDAQQHNLTPNSTNTPFHRITCAKFSSDGAHFISGSQEVTICIWDAYTGETTIGPVQVHTSQISAVDFIDDRIVLGSIDGKICVCDVRTGEVVLGPLEVGSSAIRAVAYSPNGKLIATGSYARVDVWNAQDGSRVLGPLTDLDDSVSSVQFSPDGTRIVASSWGSSSNVVVWDVSDGRNVFGTLDGHYSWVISVSHSPNGALIASGSADRTIILWDAYTGKKAVGPLTGHSHWVRSVSFSPDSIRLVSGSDDKTIRIWDVKTGEMLFQLAHGHKSDITSVEYSPAGTHILSCSRDMSVRIHDARSPEERARMHSESDVGDWTMDKDGWVVDDQSRLLVWVPGDLRKGLMWPRTRVVIGTQGYVRLKFDRSRVGESWTRGYTSHS